MDMTPFKMYNYNLLSEQVKSKSFFGSSVFAPYKHFGSGCTFLISIHWVNIKISFHLQVPAY